MTACKTLAQGLASLLAPAHDTEQGLPHGRLARASEAAVNSFTSYSGVKAVPRHGRVCPSKSGLPDLLRVKNMRNSGKPELRCHPRLDLAIRKTWMPAPSAGMTTPSISPRSNRSRFLRDQVRFPGRVAGV